jgi:TRAP-type C4-dicarboxylate transport system substrate-binding protein
LLTLIGMPFATALLIMRRRVLFAAFPAALLAGRAQANPKRLDLAAYSSQTIVGTAAQLFADKASALSARRFQIEVSELPPMMPFAAMARASALASFHAPMFSRDEPVLGLSAVPMLAATFDEAETLLRVARPYYAAALARHGQILLAVEPWRPTALWSTFRLRSGGDLRGARFARDETVYTGDGWAELFARAGTQRSSYSEAEMTLSSGYTSSTMLAREFACVTEIFFATQLTFLTANREAFEFLTEVQREDLLAIGRATEAQLWREIRPFVHRDQQEAASRGVEVTAEPPADLVTALRMAAEPDVRRWTAAMGADGVTILADYRRALGF